MRDRWKIDRFVRVNRVRKAGFQNFSRTLSCNFAKGPPPLIPLLLSNGKLQAIDERSILVLKVHRNSNSSYSPEK